MRSSLRRDLWAGLIGFVTTALGFVLVQPF